MMPLRPCSITSGDRAPPRRDHRRPAGHRLDHDEAERLLPLDRKERRARVLQQLDLLAVRHLAEILDAVDQVRLDELVEVLALLRLLHLAGELERQPSLPGDRDRAVRSLVRAHPAEEEQIVAAVRLDGIDREVERVRAVGDPVQVGFGLRWFIEIEIRPTSRRDARDQLVDLAGLAVERPVHGVHDRCLTSWRRASARASRCGR